MSEQIVEKNMLEQYTEDMQRYSVYVTRKRITPSALDGLKPVQRRIVWDMYAQQHATSFTSKTKSAAIVGSCMECYHPHGDASIYDAMKSLANWFEIKEPLITPGGNFGNFHGDPQAASRYTQANLSPFCMECVIGELQDNKQAVDWVASYNNIPEPEFLPVKVPLLLINGAMGIGVGLKVDIATHNLAEVIDETLKLIQDPSYEPVLIPDHCMPCQILNTDFKEISQTGYGSYRVRGLIDIEDFEGKPALIIKSTPNLTFLNTITEKIEELIASNKIIQIQDAFDKSTVDQMRYVILLKKGSDPNYVREVIYKNTEMEKSMRINFEVLDGITPVRMSYKTYIQNFIDFRKTTKFRVYCNELQKIQTRIHERDAYVKLLKSGEIDNIINMIKKQTNVDDTYLVEYLISKIHVTDLQAKFILNTDLRRLAIGHLKKYETELSDLTTQQDLIISKIVDENCIINEIIDELNYIKQKYGHPRICKVVKSFTDSTVPSGTFKIVITENNFIKKVQPNDSIGIRGDSPKQILIVENTENILIFDDMGKVFKLPVSKIPFTDKNTNGNDIRLLVKGLTSNIATVMYEPIVKDLAAKLHQSYLTIVTANGFMKKMDLSDFLAVNPSGLVYTKVETGDFVKSIVVIGNKTDVVIYSNRKALRFSSEMIPYLKRSTRGTREMKTEEDSLIDGMSIIKPDTTDILVVTESGKVNRFDISGMPYAKTKTGTSVIKLGKSDKIKGIYGVNSNQDVLRISLKGNKIDIPINDIPDGSSVGPGSKMISVPQGEHIIKCDIFKVQ